LVKDLQDSITAEAYCSLGGKVIPPKVAASIGEQLNLGEWASLILQGDDRSRSTSAIDVLSMNGTSTSAVELTRMLLEVYMNAGEVKVSEATKLLNAQAVNLDVQEASYSSFHPKAVSDPALRLCPPCQTIGH
jgi:vacuolar protein sorting-associated protein 3